MLYRLRGVLFALLALAPAVEAAAGADCRPTRGFEVVAENPSVNGERREVLRLETQGLVQYALLLWPDGEAPAAGWPLLLLNHGYHPNPPDYGRNARGENDRPGDYYRELAQTFVDHGIVVLVPDYRGHNDSEGLPFTEREDAPLHYACDAVAAFRSLHSLAGIDRSRRYILGHSMGSLVTLAALAELEGEVAAASLWSSSALPHDGVTGAGLELPVLIQHARGDQTTPARSSEAIARELRSGGATVELQLYDGDDHLFSGEQFRQAVALDLAWFARWRN